MERTSGRRERDVGLFCRAPLDHLEVMHARFHSLHGKQEHLQPGRLGGVRSSDSRPAVADSDRDVFLPQ
jgi:hypothetical protein